MTTVFNWNAGTCTSAMSMDGLYMYSSTEGVR